MAYITAAVILLFALAAACLLSRGKTAKRKLIVWGITAMVAMAPLLSWLAGMAYGMIARSGWAAGGMIIILFPVVFAAGLVSLLAGVFRK